MIIDGIPLRVKKNAGTLQSINLNQFLKDGFYVRKKIEKNFRVAFKNICCGIDCLPPEPPFELTYTIYRANKDRVDIGNIWAMIDKFSSDCLVALGFIDDDNVDVIKAIRIVDGGIDKQRPRARLEIKHYE
jgi:hypothetical protein